MCLDINGPSLKEKTDDLRDCLFNAFDQLNLKRCFHKVNTNLTLIQIKVKS